MRQAVWAIFPFKSGGGGEQFSLSKPCLLPLSPTNNETGSPTSHGDDKCRHATNPTLLLKLDVHGKRLNGTARASPPAKAFCGCSVDSKCLRAPPRSPPCLGKKERERTPFEASKTWKTLATRERERASEGGRRHETCCSLGPPLRTYYNVEHGSRLCST